MAALAARMATLARGRDAVVCGDWNIAHTENDIKNWKGNVKKSGFLPSERPGSPTCSPRAGSTWCGCCIPTCPGRTRGGPGAGRAFDNDAGWRIDYQLATARAGGARGIRAGGTGRGVRAALVRPRVPWSRVEDDQLV